MTTQTLSFHTRNFFRLRPLRNPSIATRTANYGVFYIAITQLADFASTVFGLHRGATEANGAMSYLLAQHGVLGFLAVKTAGAVFLSWQTYRRTYAPWIVGTIYAFVATWNMTVVLLWH